MAGKKIALILAVMFLCIGAYAIELEGFRIHNELLDIQYASAPRIFDNYLIFTYQSPEKPLFVGAAFDFDNYTKVHRYKMLPNGVFFLAIDIPPKEIIKYRLIVDGIWMADPFCNYKIVENNLVEISWLRLPVKPDDEKDYPIINSSRTEFYYSGAENINVYLAGSFNSWDPFMYRLAEKRPGEYYFSLKLPPGTHYYYFIAAGQIVQDKRNPEQAWDRNGRAVSKFHIK